MTTKVFYKKGITINTGNFESVRYELGVEEELPKGVTKEEAMDALQKYVDKKLDSCTEEVKQKSSKLTKDTEDIFKL
jgi:hypothetical protein